MCAVDRLEKENQDLIDQIVGQAGDDTAITWEQVDGLINAWGGDISEETDWIACGIKLEHIEGYLNDEQLSGVEGLDLASIDDAARIDFARVLLESTCEQFDADIVPSFRGGVILARNGGEAFVVFAVRGYAFTGISEDFYGAFTSEAAFREHARSEGYILDDEIQSSEDTKKWITDAQILSVWNRV